MKQKKKSALSADWTFVAPDFRYVTVGVHHTSANDECCEVTIGQVGVVT